MCLRPTEHSFQKIELKPNRTNRPPSWIFKNLISEHWDFLGCWFFITVLNLAQKCWSTPKLWPKIEIQDGGRPPSWIFEHLIFEHWDPLGCWFSITVLNLAQKCWSTPKLWPKIEIQDVGRPQSWILKIWFLSIGTPWAADFLSWYKILCKNVDRRRNYGPKSKSKMAAVRHLGFVTSMHACINDPR